MSDSDPSDAGPSGRLRSLFGFRKKTPEPATAASRDLDPAGAPQVMRLRLAEFEELRVDDVMVPRADIKAVEAGTGIQELLEFFAEVTHSRLPVFRESLDDPIGFVHIKDLVTELAKGGTPPRRPLESLHREVLYVPPSMKLTDLLVKMQATRIHLALVVDEYGGTDGLITLEDLVEVIVGDIEDEHDDEEAMFVRRSARVWEADARTEIEDFQEEAGVDLSLDDLDADIDTLGGVAFALAGKVPVRGEVLRHPGGTEIEIVDADSRRVRRLRLRLPEPPPQPAAEE
ncbi:CBS/transporter domain protein [Hyphomonas neptunium ATCC 15444]|uniref:CBS/transporter domain protein n=2 Tax=Hyphomonas TaxID=85 RepID=Q0C603_HYPNA|nr:MULTISPECIES: CBS domain-containing protein [Hyphomonas]ABI76609.1 CBS/transporter domain protein [Hyphomonas neptunium ATCC 15444]KCZ94918.1 CBS/transporter associated domain-containing protein [Hyphomonas hirschiana VP5]